MFFLNLSFIDISEPSLQRSVVMRNTLKELENQVFSHTPSKRINLDMGPNLYITSSQDMDSEPVEVSETRVSNKLESATSSGKAEYTELVTASCHSTTDFSVPSSPTDDTQNNKDFNSQLYFHFPPLPTLPLICSNKAESQTSCAVDDDKGFSSDEEAGGAFRIDTSDEDSNSSVESEESMDITSPTSPTVDSGSVFCTGDCQRPLLSVTKSALSGHTDELDNIMQVLVSM